MGNSSSVDGHLERSPLLKGPSLLCPERGADPGQFDDLDCAEDQVEPDDLEALSDMSATPMAGRWRFMPASTPGVYRELCADAMPRGSDIENGPSPPDLSCPSSTWRNVFLMQTGPGDMAWMGDRAA